MQLLIVKINRGIMYHTRFVPHSEVILQIQTKSLVFTPYYKSRIDPRDFRSLQTQSSHQTFLSKNECIDVIPQRRGR